MAGERVRGPRITADAVSVSFGRGAGRVLAVSGLTARFEPGITGLVGPNGAGKSTFLRTLTGLLRPSEGALLVDGLPPEAYVASQGVAFLPEAPPLPEFLTVAEFLSGIPGGDASWEAEDGDRLGLDGILSRMIGTLSLGQKKKTALRAALLSDPSLLVVDEPTNGLDPSAVRELRTLLVELGEAGRTVIVSSHHLDELQRVAQSVLFVDRGRALGHWDREAALARFGSFDTLYDHLFHGSAT